MKPKLTAYWAPPPLGIPPPPPPRYQSQVYCSPACPGSQSSRGQIHTRFLHPCGYNIKIKKLVDTNYLRFNILSNGNTVALLTPGVVDTKIFAL